MRRMTRVVSLGGLMAFALASVATAQTAHRSSASTTSAATRSSAAAADVPGFQLGTTDIGPVIGLGGLNYGASFSLGGRYEKAIKDLPDMGKGVLGIQVGASWYHSSQDYGAGCSSSVTGIPIGATANYHFHLDEKKWDPFVGLGLGYNYISAGSGCDIGGIHYGGSSSYSSGIYFIGRAGVRYYTSPKLAWYADVGAGQGALNLGVMFTLASK